MMHSLCPRLSFTVIQPRRGYINTADFDIKTPRSSLPYYKSRASGTAYCFSSYVYSTRLVCFREELLGNLENEENYNLLKDIYETLNYDCGEIFITQYYNLTSPTLVSINFTRAMTNQLNSCISWKKNLNRWNILLDETILWPSSSVIPTCFLWNHKHARRITIVGFTERLARDNFKYSWLRIV